MENKIIAFCGIICSECDAYQATQSKDMAKLEGVAAAWREGYKADFTAEGIACDGCLATKGNICSHCFECTTRACAFEHHVASCAHCPDFGCDTIKGHMNYAPPEQQQLLETMRAAYLGSAED